MVNFIQLHFIKLIIIITKFISLKVYLRLDFIKIIFIQYFNSNLKIIFNLESKYLKILNLLIVIIISFQIKFIFHQIIF